MYSNRPDRVAQLAEHWASIPKVVGSNPTVARHIFQACPVWIYTQSSNYIHHVLFCSSLVESFKNLKGKKKKLAKIKVLQVLAEYEDDDE